MLPERNAVSPGEMFHQGPEALRCHDPAV